MAQSLSPYCIALGDMGAFLVSPLCTSSPSAGHWALREDKTHRRAQLVQLASPGEEHTASEDIT